MYISEVKITSNAKRGKIFFSSQQIFISSKFTIETVEKTVKYVQS